MMTLQSHWNPNQIIYGLCAETRDFAEILPFPQNLSQKLANFVNHVLSFRLF